MVFNVLAHNKDDHAKNFAFLRDPVCPGQGVWRLAPAFDLTFNAGMNNNHTTAINGAGRRCDFGAFGPSYTSGNIQENHMRTVNIRELKNNLLQLEAGFDVPDVRDETRWRATRAASSAVMRASSCSYCGWLTNRP